MVLCNRLMQWLSPYREQAGNQPKRHITYSDYEYCSTLPEEEIFIIFDIVDFSQAYDRVPRAKLMGVLRRLGCGAVMLTALVAMCCPYSVSIAMIMIKFFAVNVKVDEHGALMTKQ